jgi:hypothetical protein
MAMGSAKRGCLSLLATPQHPFYRIGVLSDDGWSKLC